MDAKKSKLERDTARYLAARIIPLVTIQISRLARKIAARDNPTQMTEEMLAKFTEDLHRDIYSELNGPHD